MGVLGWVLAPALRARASPVRVPLFGVAIPEGARDLERAINVARTVGVLLLAIGIASGQVSAPLGPILAVAIGAQAAFVSLALRPEHEWSARGRAASSVGDIVVVGLALFELADQPVWTAPAVPLLSIVVVGLRSGRGGAFLAAVGCSLLLFPAATYRAAIAGIPTEPSTFGSWITLYLICALVISGAMRELGILRERQRHQHDRDAALLAAQSDLGEMLLVTDGERVLEANDALRRIAGTAGGALADLFTRDDIGRITARALTGTAERIEARMSARGGRVADVEVAAKRVHGDGGRYIVVAHDITDRKRAERAFQLQSLYDPLTLLPGRALLRDRIAGALARASAEATAVSVLMLDVAHFRSVNDSFGFDAGDEILRGIASRLRECVDEIDTIARLGGDEFVIVLADGGPDRCDRTIRSIDASLRSPFSVGGSSVAMDITVGIARYPEHGGDPETLLQHAGSALYEAKVSGSASATYVPERGTMAPSQLIVADIQRAIASDEIVLHYQPQVSMANGTIVGLEALARWRHPRLGLLAPSEFVPLIERTSMGRAFFDHVLLRALRESALWKGPLSRASLAVNLSGRDLLDPSLPGTVRMILGQDRPADRLTLEVTERILLADPAHIRSTVSAIRDLGVRFSIDDFGTGGSSLVHLVQLPIAELKVDRSFITDLRTDDRRRAVVRSTIDIAHALGSHVVAEGIEDPETWAMLKDMGCDAAQGYLIAKPMPAGELVDWLAASSYAT